MKSCTGAWVVAVIARRGRTVCPPPRRSWALVRCFWFDLASCSPSSSQRSRSLVGARTAVMLRLASPTCRKVAPALLHLSRHWPRCLLLSHLILAPFLRSTSPAAPALPVVDASSLLRVALPNARHRDPSSQSSLSAVTCSRRRLPCLPVASQRVPTSIDHRSLSVGRLLATLPARPEL